MDEPVTWRCAVGTPCAPKGKPDFTNLVVGVVDTTTSDQDPLDPTLVDVMLTRVLDHEVAKLKDKKKDPKGGIDFRFEHVQEGWYEVRATRRLKTGGLITREATRVVRVVKLVPMVRPSDEHQAVRLILEESPSGLRDYKEALIEAVDSLKNTVRFGRADLDPMRFDDKNWDIAPDDEFHTNKLQLKSGVPAHKAIDDIIVKAFFDEWSLDCAQFVQVCQMFARLHSIGAAAFDREVGRLELRRRDSRGCGVFTEFNATPIIHGASKRTEFGDPFLDEAKQEFKLADVLAQAPVGSLVQWMKPNEQVITPATTPGGEETIETEEQAGPFLNEHTLKIGEDVYHAHGFKKGNPFALDDFKKEYAAHTKPNAGPGDVFVVRVAYVMHRGLLQGRR